MNVLVIGAGSIGQVFAHHLLLAGASVSILARESQRAGGSRGQVLYPLNRRNARRLPIHSPPLEILTPGASARTLAWDQIYMCVPSDALEGSLLEWVAANSSQATVVKLQPGLKDRERYDRHISEDRIVSGMLSIISYTAPLADEHIPESGTAYWFPPLLPCLFSGQRDRVEQVTDALRAGGFPAATRKDVDRLVAYVLAVEAPILAGVECAQWSIEGFIRGPWLKVGSRAILEATNVVSTYFGVRAPRAINLAKPRVLNWILRMLPKKHPIPLEAYLERHFTKLSTQSRQHLDDYIEVGSEHSLQIESLVRLRESLNYGQSDEPGT